MSMPIQQNKKDFSPCCFWSSQSLTKDRTGSCIWPRLDIPFPGSQSPSHDSSLLAGVSSCEYVTPFDRLVWKAADAVESQSASFQLQQKVNPGLTIAKLGVNYIATSFQLSFHHLVGAWLSILPQLRLSFQMAMRSYFVLWEKLSNTCSRISENHWLFKIRTESVCKTRSCRGNFCNQWGIGEYPQQVASGKVDSQRHSLLILGKAKMKNIF